MNAARALLSSEDLSTEEMRTKNSPLSPEALDMGRNLKRRIAEKAIMASNSSYRACRSAIKEAQSAVSILSQTSQCYPMVSQTSSIYRSWLMCQE